MSPSTAISTESSGQKLLIRSPGRTGDEVGALVEHDDVIGEALRLHEVVGAHHDGVAVARHVADQLQYGLGRLGVEARRRLVEQQQPGLVQDGTGEREPGLHAGRVPADLGIERVLDVEAAGGGSDPLVDDPLVDAVEFGGVAKIVRAASVGRRAPASPTRRRRHGEPLRRRHRDRVRACARCPTRATSLRSRSGSPSSFRRRWGREGR